MRYHYLPTRMAKNWSTPCLGKDESLDSSYSPWGHKESDTTERLDWTEPNTVGNNGSIC